MTVDTISCLFKGFTRTDLITLFICLIKLLTIITKLALYFVYTLFAITNAIFTDIIRTLAKLARTTVRNAIMVLQIITSRAALTIRFIYTSSTLRQTSLTDFFTIREIFNRT